MDGILPTYILHNVFNFLTIKDIQNYDSASLCKENREHFLHALSIYKPKRLNITRWTILRDIKSEYEFCYIPYIDYVSTICKLLIVYYKNIRDLYELNIYNDTLITLHLHFTQSNKVYIKSLQCKNLENLFLVYIKHIDITIFKTLPNLKTVTFFSPLCDIEEIRPNLNNNIILKSYN
jgi:hypothetical protein